MILILGDLILDETHWVDVTKLSPEAPVPVAYLKNKSKITLGGAGLAATYAHRHDIPYKFYTFGQNLRKDLLGPIEKHIIMEWTEGYVIKTRYIDEATGYHLIRIDNDNTLDRCIRLDYEDIINEAVENNCKVLMMLDYNKGIFNSVDDTRTLIYLAKDNGILTYVDSRRKNLQGFMHADILKLNNAEYLEALYRYDVDTKEELANWLKIQSIIVTKGSAGAENSALEYIPDLNKYRGVPDVTGCGDVFDINYCNCLLKMLPFKDCLKIAVDKATEFAYEPMEIRLCLT